MCYLVAFFLPTDNTDELSPPCTSKIQSLDHTVREMAGKYVLEFSMLWIPFGSIQHTSAVTIQGDVPDILLVMPPHKKRLNTSHFSGPTVEATQTNRSICIWHHEVIQCNHISLAEGNHTCFTAKRQRAQHGHSQDCHQVAPEPNRQPRISPFPTTRREARMKPAVGRSRGWGWAKVLAYILQQLSLIHI